MDPIPKKGHFHIFDEDSVLRIWYPWTCHHHPWFQRTFFRFRFWYIISCPPHLSVPENPIPFGRISVKIVDVPLKTRGREMVPHIITVRDAPSKLIRQKVNEHLMQASLEMATAFITYYFAILPNRTFEKAQCGKTKIFALTFKKIRENNYYSYLVLNKEILRKFCETLWMKMLEISSLCKGLGTNERFDEMKFGATYDFIIKVLWELELL